MTKITNQRTKSRLDQLDAKFADQIWSVKDETTLRLFACECASLALTNCGNSDQRSFNGVEIASRYTKNEANDQELDLAYADAESAAEAADEAAFKARDALEEGKAPADEYNQAFGIARAAFSAQETCRKDAMKAAHEAAYEAWAALSTAIEAGSTLNDLLPRNLSNTAAADAAIVEIFRNILEKFHRV